MSRRKCTITNKFLLRLIDIMEAEGYNFTSDRGKFADYIGIARSYMSGILNEKNKNPYKLICGIANCFPFYNINWLLTGEGEMYRSPGEAAPVPPGVSEPDPGRVSSEGYAAAIAKDYTLVKRIFTEMEEGMKKGLTEGELFDILERMLEIEQIKQRRRPRPQPEPAVEPLPRPLPDSTILDIMRRIVKEEVPPEGSPERRKCMAEITKVLKESDDIKGDISPETP